MASRTPSPPRLSCISPIRPQYFVDDDGILDDEIEKLQQRLKKLERKRELQQKIRELEANSGECDNNEHDENKIHVNDNGNNNRNESSPKPSPGLNTKAPAFRPIPWPSYMSYDDRPAIPKPGYLTPEPCHSVQQQHQSLVDVISSSLSMPPLKLPVFTGNCMEYPSFIRCFEDQIEARDPSDSRRLQYLLQYTTGEPHNLIRGCCSMDPVTGYAEAKATLRKRYGDKFMVAMACIDQVTQVPPIKISDRTGLMKFSDKLKSCTATLADIGFLNEINSRDNLQRIAEKLPYQLITKWLSQVDNLKQMNVIPRIDDLTKFVESESRKVNDPLFGSLLDNKRQNDRTQHKPTPKPRTSFSTQANHVKPSSKESPSESISCGYCNEKHCMFKCESFKKNLTVQQRNDFVKEKGICYGCLRTGHSAYKCSRSEVCGIDGCELKHARLLHIRKRSRNEAQGISQPSQLAAPAEATASSYCSLNGAGAKINLPIVPVRVRGTGQRDFVDTYALLDAGSNTSFCDDYLLDVLNLSGQQTKLTLTTLEASGSVRSSRLVSLEVCDMTEQELINLPQVYSYPKLPVYKDSIPDPSDFRKWPHLADIEVDKLKTTKVSLLIGNDAPEALEPIDVRKGSKGSPFATRTRLGWTLNGPTGSVCRPCSATTNFIHSDRQLSEQVKKYFNMEFNDSLVDDGLSKSIEDARAEHIMENSIRAVGGHYEMKLPWRDDGPNLPDNRTLAETRLAGLKRRFERQPDVFKRYSQVIEGYIDSGYAIKAPPTSVKKGRVWYLPHHAVVHPKKPDKVRVVYDCAAKFHGISLNSRLLQGKDNTNSIVGVLSRFRLGTIAMMADVESMFHRVRVHPDDQSTLRFLWWPDSNMQATPVVYQMQVFVFGAISSPSCVGYALRKAATDQADQFSPDCVTTVWRNFYVDDCLKATDTEDKAIQLISELCTMLANRGFRLTKWTCNSRTVMESVPESERSKQIRSLDMGDLPMERALGVQWNVETDSFEYDVSPNQKPLSRRGILSVMSSVYDPLGLVSPFVLEARMILQDACRLKIGWDDPLPSEISNRWNQWLSDLPQLKQMSVNRCIKPTSQPVECNLHHFADASLKGYGTVSYLRTVEDKGTIHCNIVMAKSRVAPLKAISVPRMELSAAVLAVRMDKLLKKELDLQLGDSVFWTDSTSVLAYIRNETRRFHTFVANRVATIRDGSTPDQWHHVSTDRNPADDASRGMAARKLVTSERWLHGPDYLLSDEDNWPSGPSDPITIPDDDCEVKKSSCAATQSIVEKTSPVDSLLNYYDTWHSVKKAVAWFIRVKRCLRNRVLKKKPCSPVIAEATGRITVEELRTAERSILRRVQSKEFTEDISKSHRLRKLTPVVKDGLICVGGRLRNATIPEETRHPVILPKRHHIVDLIIKHYHHMSGHSGREHVLALVRQRYWIIKGRAAIRSALKDCHTCTRQRAPRAEQQMADLPRRRVTAYEAPFTDIGIDYFGPIMTKHGRSQEKRYGCIMTCMNTRAVHIEVAESLETSAFLNALFRFIARRGPPKSISSDNGTNFVGGEREIRQAIKSWNPQVSDTLLKHDIQWRFNPPAASHWGGVWERQIRTIRKILSTLCNQQTLTDDALSTLLCQIEGIINSRPLAYVSDDPKDLSVLTPSHMLLQRSGSYTPPGNFTKEDNYVRRRWRQVQYLANVFWSRWLREYLPTLQERHKWFTVQRDFKVGDLVLVASENTSRNDWPLGRIINVTPGSDGKVRAVRVKTRGTELNRPITKLCLLEQEK